MRALSVVATRGRRRTAAAGRPAWRPAGAAYRPSACRACVRGGRSPVGLAGVMNSSPMPSFSHFTDSAVRPPAPLEPQGEPLSMRNRSGRPYSFNIRSISTATADPGRRADPAADKISAHRIAHRQAGRSAFHPRVRNQPLKSMLQVSFACDDRRERSCQRQRAASPPALADQTAPLQHLSDRRGRRPADLRAAVRSKNAFSFFGPQRRMVEPAVHQRRADTFLDRTRLNQRRPRARHHAAQAFRRIAPHQRVARLPADPVLARTARSCRPIPPKADP